VIQFTALCGKNAGAHWIARRFPTRIGRAPNSDLCLEEDGVWDCHLQIDSRPQEGFFLSVQPGARAFINAQPVEETFLRNGDIIEVGAAKLQFSLSPTRPRSLRWREVLTWVALAALCLGQVALVYWLPG